MSVPVSSSSPGMEMAISSYDTAIAMYSIKELRNAFRESYDKFRKEYPECDVDLATFRCACRYNEANRQLIRNIRHS